MTGNRPFEVDCRVLLISFIQENIGSPNWGKGDAENTGFLAFGYESLEKGRQYYCQSSMNIMAVSMMSDICRSTCMNAIFFKNKIYKKNSLFQYMYDRPHDHPLCLLYQSTYVYNLFVREHPSNIV